jgi:hypothetical protein
VNRRRMAAATAALALLASIATTAVARPRRAHRADAGVESANHRSGHPATKLADGFALRELVKGSDPLENPSGPITRYGQLADSPPNAFETRTEPDQNLYLKLDHPGGPTPGYDYGRHFLFQAHEVASGNLAYVTRVNLDVSDPKHRITLLTPTGADGKTGFTEGDGSTWDPFSGTLLFTQESTDANGVIEITPGWPPKVTPLTGILGQGGYEGIHPDDRGDLYLAEDVGGSSTNVVPGDATSPKNARQPNSFIYRFQPSDPTDLSKGGRLQALQVSIDEQPVTFHAGDLAGDVFSLNQLLLHMPGTSWPVKWVTVHDTATNGTAPFNANDAAKAAGATPFKRPENLAWLPASGFRTLFFDPTGDTSALSGGQSRLASRGAWGSIFRLDLSQDRDAGELSIFALGDALHSSFDNLAFTADGHRLLAAEDRGDTLHKQLDRLDSVWSYDVGDPGEAPTRFLALGRDPLSEQDAANLDAGTAGFQNDGDNEPTGLYVSDGRSSVDGLLGRRPAGRHARWFVTQQHGANTTYQIVRDGH